MGEKNGKMKVRKISMATNVRNSMIFICVLVLVIMAVLSTFTMRNSLIATVKENVSNYAQIAASQVDGDAFATVREKGADSEEYKTIHDQLAKFLDNDIIKYIYSMDLGSEGLEFVVDTDPEEPGEIGEAYENAPDEMLASIKEDKITTDKNITTDEWGSFISGYAPIHNSNGEVVGMIGVDCTAQTVKDKCGVFYKKIFIIGLCCLLFTFLLATLPYTMLKKRLGLVNAKLEDVVYNDGDLTKRIDIATGDEFEVIAGNLNALMESTRDMISNIKQSANTIQVASDKMDTNMGHANEEVQSIRTHLHQMGDGLESTAANMEEIRAMVDSVGSIVKDVNDGSVQGAQVAEEISERASSMTQQSGEAKLSIQTQVEHLHELLEENFEKASEVSKIESLTEDILEISGQTKLLALNANIEAARAGEMGKGFAVVAGSIGELAESSSSAASNIQIVSKQVISVVDEMMSLTKNMLSFITDDVMEKFTELTDAGSQYATDANRLNEILTQFKDEMDRLDLSVNDIQQAVDNVTNICVTNHEDISDINAFANQVQEELSTTTALSTDNKNEVEQLHGVVNHYTV